MATRPDRGDLPLVTGIWTYLAMAAAGAVSLLEPTASPNFGFAVAGASVLALPVSVIATSYFDPDPGDTRLVFDGMLWGGLLGVSLAPLLTGSLAPRARPLSNREFGVGGLLGMHIGGGLALWLARTFHPSLERVRLATVTAYGSVLVSGILAFWLTDRDDHAVAITMAGGALGLAAGFAGGAGHDDPPDGVRWFDHPVQISTLTPTLLPSRDARGRVALAPGIYFVRGRF